MNKPTHQTVRLESGRHHSPQQGACVMELASMLAGEPFSDHPAAVSPSIAAFLRAYNDMLDDTRRQDLYACAAMVVGTNSTAEAERMRMDRLIAWADEVRDRRFQIPLLSLLRRRDQKARLESKPDAAARYAINAIRKVSDQTHAGALALVAELVAMGASPEQDAATDFTASDERWLLADITR